MTSKNSYSFKTETQKMLDIMIHSIYTHKEIFLRELISNSADALNKVRFQSLSNENIDKDNLKIDLELDKDKRTITIKDTGIGMSEKEVIKNIGTVAQSGSQKFVKALKEEEDALDIIGQFGVGFYSSFMVASAVEIETKKEGEEAVYWHSEGLDSYVIESSDKKERGTKITLHLREGDEFDRLLESDKIKSLVKKHSNYIPFPIYMDVETQVPDEDADEEYAMKTVVENQVLNSMKPLWKKRKSEIEQKDYNEFYKNNYFDFEDPLKVIHTKAEGRFRYNAMLFIPNKLPQNFMQPDANNLGIDLYSKQVFIMKNADNVLPDYLNFVKGVVESPDFSLNISRELLQKNRLINKIGNNLEKKILRKLENTLKKDRKEYEKWWNEFGVAIKTGIHQNPNKKDDLKDLLIFNTNKSEDAYRSLPEYVDSMKEDQDSIYYLVTQDKEKAMNLPQLEKINDKGYEVLFFTDPVDEFMIRAIDKFDDYELKSLNKASDDFEDNEKIDKIKEENDDLLSVLKDNLDENIDEIKISSKLKDTAVCLVTDDMGMSLHTEEMLKKVQDIPSSSKKILEINPDHKVFNVLKQEFKTNKNSNKLKEYSELLLNQAYLMEGLELENPTKFANQISKLMTK